MSRGGVLRAWTLLVALVGCGKAEGTDSGPPTPTDGTAETGTATEDTGTGPATDPGPNLNTTGDAETCAVLFGDNDRIRGPDEGLPLGGVPRTAQAWVRTSSMRDQVAVSWGRPSPHQGFQLGTVDGKIMARTGSGGEIVVGDTLVADDRWHHLAASWDGRLVVLMVDGRSDGTGELTGESLEGDLVAGNTPTGDLTSPWIGWLDDVKVIAGTRLPVDVARDPDALTTVDPADVQVWWDFEGVPADGGADLAVPDLSGHGHDGTTAGVPGEPLFPACR